MRTLGAIERRRAAAFAGRVVAPGTVSVHVRKGDKWVEVRALLDDIVLYQKVHYHKLNLHKTVRQTLYYVSKL